MPEPLPEIAPWEPRAGHLRIVPDGPAAASLMGAEAPAPAPPEPSAERVPVRSPDSPATAGADARAVTDTPPEAVTDGLSGGVTDTDADTDDRLPAIAEFGREIGPLALLGIAAARKTGVIGGAAVKGAVKSSTWTAPPQSMAGHSAWVNSREWVPEDVRDEPVIKFLVFLRQAWGWTFGLLFTGLGNFVNWLRVPQHFLLAFGTYLLLLWLHVIHVY